MFSLKRLIVVESLEMEVVKACVLLFDRDEEEFGELSLEAIEDEEVALADGAFEGAFGALGDESWCFGEGVLVSF
ncbi:hypothetical protein Tco_0776345 [Tanacetum coccineum]